MKIVLDKEAIRRSLVRMTHEIMEHNQGVDNVVLVGIETRGLPLANRLATLIKQFERTEIEVVSLNTSAWRDDSKRISEKPSLEVDFTGKDVVIVDDVLQSGRTIRAAMDAVIEYGRPKSIQLAILVDRGHREFPIRPDYVGKNIPSSSKEFVRVNVEEIDDVDQVYIA